MIRLEQGDFSFTFLVVDVETGQDILIQTDWDYPATASAFGWQACECGYTDGTVDCAHKTAHDMIAEAWEFLSDNIGAETEDPGYFS